MPRFEWKDDDMAHSLTFFPFVGAVIGAVICLLNCISPFNTLPVAVRIILSILVPLIITGGFHVDGFMDCSDAIMPVLYAYFLLLGIGLIIYMVRATRQYGRWLRDNYADLEHKEVWQSLVVLAIIMMAFSLYAYEHLGLFFKYAARINTILLTGFLVWRAETLSDLSQFDSKSVSTSVPSETIDDDLSSAVQDKIGLLLQQHCVDTQLYLQHDLTLLQLAKAVGTNRLYLSQYFSSLGTTYNAYINDLRINHFVSLYREAVAAQRHFTAQQLAHDSGYQSYSTFSLAFKQRMGQSVTVWMRSAD